MRALGLILFFQIVLLVAQPCADLEGVVSTDQSTPPCVAARSDGSDTRGKNECPPLCVCSCCIMAAETPDVVVGFVLPILEHDVATPRVAITYNSLIPAYHRPTIWQPPKV